MARDRRGPKFLSGIDEPLGLGKAVISVGLVAGRLGVGRHIDPLVIDANVEASLALRKTASSEAQVGRSPDRQCRPLPRGARAIPPWLARDANGAQRSRCRSLRRECRRAHRVADSVEGADEASTRASRREPPNTSLTVVDRYDQRDFRSAYLFCSNTQRSEGWRASRRE